MKWITLALVVLAGCQERITDTEKVIPQEQEVTLSAIIGTWLFVEEVDGVYVERTYTFSENAEYSIQYLERKLGLNVILTESGYWHLNDNVITFKVERDERHAFRKGVIYQRRVSMLIGYLFLDNVGGSRIITPKA